MKYLAPPKWIRASPVAVAGPSKLLRTLKLVVVFALARLLLVSLVLLLATFDTSHLAGGSFESKRAALDDSPESAQWPASRIRRSEKLDD